MAIKSMPWCSEMPWAQAATPLAWRRWPQGFLQVARRSAWTANAARGWMPSAWLSVEAWSRAPIRQTRPLHATDLPTTYERPAFAPDPTQDPDLLEAASEHAFARQFSRAQQDAYALLSHERAVRAQQSAMQHDLVTIAACDRDMYPRHIDLARAARMPVIAHARADEARRFGLSALTVSAKADGAATVARMKAMPMARPWCCLHPIAHASDSAWLPRYAGWRAQASAATRACR